MVPFLLLILVAWILIVSCSIIEKRINKFVRKHRPGTHVFDGNYIDVKKFYIDRFGEVPCMIILNDIDMAASYNHISGIYKNEIVDIFQVNDYNRDEDKQEFRQTTFVLRNNVVIELCYEDVYILFSNRHYAFSNQLVDEIKMFPVQPKKKDHEINIISKGHHGLYLKPLAIDPTDLDIDLYYNDGFAAVDELMRNRLNAENDKGIVLLHGLPGTGKTTYLRHLIGAVNKKIMFISPSAADNLMSPDLMDILVSNPNSILVIEDAENVIMDRKIDGNSSVSNLLNISDGLLSDCLNVQIICTFNSALSMVDSALMRKGRLIAKYEFDKLSVNKAQRLSDHLGFNSKINRPMTVAEISNQNDMEFAVNQTQVIGFRREQLILEN